MILPVIKQTDGSKDAGMCKACGGKCCQHMPGAALPSDFGPKETLAQTIAEYLRTGFWCVDWWEGDPRPDGPLSQVYFVRPATVGKKGKLLDGSWGGACILWSEKGCSLKFENRPAVCRNLIPTDVGHGCHFDNPMFEKEGMVREWIPFQREVEAAMKAAEEAKVN